MTARKKAVPVKPVRMPAKPPSDPNKAFAWFVSKCANGFCAEMIERGRTATQARNMVVHMFLDFAAGEACRIAREDDRKPNPEKWTTAATDAFVLAEKRTRGWKAVTPIPQRRRRS